MTTIKGTLKACISETSDLTPREIKEHIDNGNHEYLINRLTFSGSDMSRYGWVEVGTSNIEVTLHSQDEVVEKLADGLREQISMVRADAQLKVSQLEEKLSQLLSLPNPEQTAEREVQP